MDIWRRLTCQGEPPPKHEFNVLCVGLTKAGKTTFMSQLLNEDARDIQPTTGFSCKDIVCERAILKVKELGGSEHIMPYWDRYYTNCLAVIYVLDPNCSEEDRTLNMTQFHKVTTHPHLTLLPTMVLVLSKTAHCCDATQIRAMLQMNESHARTTIDIHAIDDTSAIRQSLEKLSRTLIDQRDKITDTTDYVVTNQI